MSPAEAVRAGLCQGHVSSQVSMVKQTSSHASYRSRQQHDQRQALEEQREGQSPHQNLRHQQNWIQRRHLQQLGVEQDVGEHVCCCLAALPRLGEVSLGRGAQSCPGARQPRQYSQAGLTSIRRRSRSSASWPYSAGLNLRCLRFLLIRGASKHQAFMRSMHPRSSSADKRAIYFLHLGAVEVPRWKGHVAS